MVTSPSLPSQNGERNEFNVILFNTKLLALSAITTSSAPVGVVFCVCPCISNPGVTAIGLPAPSKPITWLVVPVRYVSTPEASVINALFAVNPVLVPQAMLSLVLERVLIELVLPAMSPESVSSADLIAPDIDPRVNICANVILDVAYVSCLATTVSIIDSCPAVGVGIISSSGICLDIRLYGLSE